MNGEDHSHGMNNNNMSEQQRSTADSPLADALQSDEYHKLASLAMVKSAMEKRRRFSISQRELALDNLGSTPSLSGRSRSNSMNSLAGGPHVTIPVLSMAGPGPAGSGGLGTSRVPRTPGGRGRDLFSLVPEYAGLATMGGSGLSLSGVPDTVPEIETPRGAYGVTPIELPPTFQPPEIRKLTGSQHPDRPPHPLTLPGGGSVNSGGVYSALSAAGHGHFIVEEIDVTSVDAFQRVVVTGTSTLSGEQASACALLRRALALREKHVYRKPTYYWGHFRPDDFPFSPPFSSASLATAGHRSTSAPLLAPAQYQQQQQEQQFGSRAQTQASNWSSTDISSGGAGGDAAAGHHHPGDTSSTGSDGSGHSEGHKHRHHHEHDSLQHGSDAASIERRHRHHSQGQQHDQTSTMAALQQLQQQQQHDPGMGRSRSGFDPSTSSTSYHSAAADAAATRSQVEVGARSQPASAVAPVAAAAAGVGISERPHPLSDARPAPLSEPVVTQQLWGSNLVTAETGKQYGNLFYRRRPEPRFKPFKSPLPPAAPHHSYVMVDGVVEVYDASSSAAFSSSQQQQQQPRSAFSSPFSSPMAGAAAASSGNSSTFADAQPRVDAHPSGGNSGTAAAITTAGDDLPSTVAHQRPSNSTAAAAANAHFPSTATQRQPINLFPGPSFDEYWADYQELVSITYTPYVKSFAFRRLELLESRFQLHVKLNADREVAESKANPHRDFYNCRKVDTHVHHSACMNQKHLLRFIKRKLKHSPEEIVIFRDGKYLTLAQVFESLSLTAYDLSIDSLDMHADWSTFHRFDRFNLKYSPNQSSRLREIFLKTDNLIKGRYLAEITREVFDDLEASKYQLAEYRLSIYGKSKTEWSKLAAWVVDNNLASTNVRWMIQVPRLYELYKSSGQVNNFQDMLDAIFLPLFEVTRDPSVDPKLHQFLTLVVGLDSVDDESTMEANRDSAAPPKPSDWTLQRQPPYYYWNYYLSANLRVLNSYRAYRGMTQFSFRPHSGEAGDIDHLAATFLTAESINHGINLKRSPSLQFLYYLARVGLALSPLSNNRLFVEYTKNPFFEFFQKGLNVSLSTDDPLMLAFTKEPLLEEYCVAAQVWKLSSVDMCEIARNSVLQSGFEHPFKTHFIGQSYMEPGPLGNDIIFTNVPYIRLQYRVESWRAEVALVQEGAAQQEAASLQHLVRRESSSAVPAAVHYTAVAATATAAAASAAAAAAAASRSSAVPSAVLSPAAAAAATAAAGITSSAGTTVPAAGVPQQQQPAPVANISAAFRSSTASSGSGGSPEHHVPIAPRSPAGKPRHVLRSTIGTVVLPHGYNHHDLYDSASGAGGGGDMKPRGPAVALISQPGAQLTQLESSTEAAQNWVLDATPTLPPPTQQRWQKQGQYTNTLRNVDHPPDATTVVSHGPVLIQKASSTVSAPLPSAAAPLTTTAAAACDTAAAPGAGIARTDVNAPLSTSNSENACSSDLAVSAILSGAALPTGPGHLFGSTPRLLPPSSATIFTATGSAVSVADVGSSGLPILEKGQAGAVSLADVHVLEKGLA